jgi:hypothetical protein
MSSSLSVLVVVAFVALWTLALVSWFAVVLYGFKAVRQPRPGVRLWSRATLWNPAKCAAPARAPERAGPAPPKQVPSGAVGVWRVCRQPALRRRSDRDSQVRLSNMALERPAGSHSLAAAAHCRRYPDLKS